MIKQRHNPNNESLLLLCPNCTSQIPYMMSPGLTIKKTLCLRFKCSCSPNLIKKSANHYLMKLKKLGKKKNHYCPMNHHHLKKVRSKKYCSICQTWLCTDTLFTHNNTYPDHLLVDIELNLSCFKHKVEQIQFCQSCNVSQCSVCCLDSDHSNHNMLSLSDFDNKIFEQNYEAIDENIQHTKQVTQTFWDAFANKEHTEQFSESSLEQWKKTIEKEIKLNKYINYQLAQLCQIILNTIKTLSKVKSYGLMQTLKAWCIAPKSTFTFENTNDSIDEMRINLKKFSLTHFIIQWQYQNYQMKGCWIADIQIEDYYISAITQLIDERIAIAANKKIFLWCQLTSSSTNTLVGHLDSISQLTQLLNGKLASSSYDSTIKLWNVALNTCIATLNQFNITNMKGIETTKIDIIHCFCELSDKSLIYGCENAIMLWENYQIKDSTIVLNSKGTIFSIIRLNNGHFAAGGREKVIFIINESMRYDLISKLKTTEGTKALVQLFDGRLISQHVTFIQIWNMTTFQCLTRWSFDNSSPLCQLADRRLAFCYFDSEVLILNPNSLMESMEMQENHIEGIFAMQLMNGQLLTCSGAYSFSDFENSISLCKIWDNIEEEYDSD